MNFYIKIDGKDYKITRYSYRLSSVQSDTKISHVFTCNALSYDQTLSGELEFYSDEILVYSDPINEAFKSGFNFSVQSEKIINVPTPKIIEANDVFTYTSSSVRVPVDFSIIPLDSINTSVGDFLVGAVTHSSFYSDVTIG